MELAKERQKAGFRSLVDLRADVEARTIELQGLRGVADSAKAKAAGFLKGTVQAIDGAGPQIEALRTAVNAQSTTAASLAQAEAQLADAKAALAVRDELHAVAAESAALWLEVALRLLNRGQPKKVTQLKLDDSFPVKFGNIDPALQQRRLAQLPATLEIIGKEQKQVLQIIKDLELDKSPDFATAFGKVAGLADAEAGSFGLHFLANAKILIAAAIGGGIVGLIAGRLFGWFLTVLAWSTRWAARGVHWLSGAA